MFKFVKLLFFVVMLLISFDARAQSFGCGDKTGLNFAEQTICSDPALSALDSRLNGLYQQAMKTSLQAKSLKKDQQVWLRNNRNLCANDKKCLTETYQSRMNTLSALIANPKAKIPESYPVRWDHSIDMPPQNPGPTLSSIQK